MVFAVSTLVDDERIGLVVGSTMKALVLPVGAIVSMLLYFDARIRKEGFDLQVQEEGLETTVTGGER